VARRQTLDELEGAIASLIATELRPRWDGVRSLVAPPTVTVDWFGRLDDAGSVNLATLAAQAHLYTLAPVRDAPPTAAARARPPFEAMWPDDAPEAPLEFVLDVGAVHRRLAAAVPSAYGALEGPRCGAALGPTGPRRRRLRATVEGGRWRSALDAVPLQRGSAIPVSTNAGERAAGGDPEPRAPPEDPWAAGRAAVDRLIDRLR
jgi:hypothetical protein